MSRDSRETESESDRGRLLELVVKMDSLVGRCWNCNGKASVECSRCNIALYCSQRCNKQDVFRHQVECNFLTVKGQCSQCGKATETKWCSSCRLDRYCSRKCQKDHGREHKVKCLFSSQYCAMLIINWIKSVPVCVDMPWFWGNSLAADYLKLFQNEGLHCKQQCLTLLFGACGDLRNVFKTVADLPVSYKGKLKFYLNDYSSHIMARNVLFLFLSLTVKDVLVASNLIVQLWYSLLLSETDYAILMTTLEKLIQIDSDQLSNLTENLIQIDRQAWAAVQVIYTAWLSHHAWLDKKMMQMQWLQRSCGSTIKAFFEDYLSGVPVRHLRSLRKWHCTGLVLRDEENLRAKAVRPNVSLLCFNPLNPVSVTFPELNLLAVQREEWCKYIQNEEMMILFWDGRSMPFRGWDYVDIVEAVGLQDDIVGAFQKYVTDVVGVFTSLVRKKRISFHVMVQDILSVARNLPKDLKFDRIATSNTADYCRTHPLLECFGYRLNSEANPRSVLIVEYRNWNFRCCPVSNRFQEQELKVDVAILSCIGDLIQRPSRRNQINNLMSYLGSEKSRREYYDDFMDFLMTLRAERMFDDVDKKFGAVIRNASDKQEKNLLMELAKQLYSPYKTPTQSDIFTHCGLEMRKFWKGLNRVLPFQYKMNARRVSHVIGYERSIEWIGQQTKD